MSVLDTKIEFAKGVGTKRADLLKTELNLHTFRDVLEYYPFRHEDRTELHKAKNLLESMTVAQLKGKILYTSLVGEGAKQRLVATFSDGTGEVDLVWFHGINGIQKFIKSQTEYLIYGQPQFFNGKFSFIHPEMELYQEEGSSIGLLYPVYNTTEKLKRNYVNSKALSKVVQAVLEKCVTQLPETLSDELRAEFELLPRPDAVRCIHFPPNVGMLAKAKKRLKFEELFFIQLQLVRQKRLKQQTFHGMVCRDTKLFTDFFENHLPFELTDAQKRVLKEIYTDMASGKQMNRLLQGDVGSGKTIVAFMAMLIAVGNGAQACLMAPTEILADQHYRSLEPLATAMGLQIDLLTGSTRTRVRRVMHQRLENGNLHLLVGTHALLEDKVQFENLGLCIIDEQHRFGVEQRSRLWTKNEQHYPHILVMTATPIPRTLAMTLYGDLDVSVIDQLPAGRKPIVTAHRYDAHRLRVFGFIKEQIAAGRQAYIVYPLIEESEKLDYKNLMDGYESVCRAFPGMGISIVHGQMGAPEKEYEMQRFVKGETKIMVATTVIEVGVNVPNASVMVIENAERFGLAQLHQLRGRVGRGAEQSYCILMTKDKLSQDGKIRIDTMVRTTNGFEIADVDLQLRGPGDLMGKQQSGTVDLIIADLAQDGELLQQARTAAIALLEHDPQLQRPQNAPIRNQLNELARHKSFWSRIS